MGDGRMIMNDCGKLHIMYCPFINQAELTEIRNLRIASLWPGFKLDTTRIIGCELDTSALSDTVWCPVHIDAM
jgi:hypothetical protein